MPTTDDLELPIERIRISGSAVDAHNNRKEQGSTIDWETRINYIGSLEAIGRRLDAEGVSRACIDAAIKLMRAE